MNRNAILPIFVLVLFCTCGFSQTLQVETLLDLNASGGVTFGPDGNIYISDFGPSLGAASSNTKVYQMEYGTWEVSEFATGFSGASGARFDNAGNFYQSNPSGARVSKRLPDGSVAYNWVSSGLNVPIGITNDAAQNLYVCNCGSNTIQKLTPSGTSSLFASSSLFNCPNGITIDPAGILYACNFSDGRVLKIMPNGTVSTLATLPIFGGVGNGHLTYSNGYIFLAAIGVGQIFKISLSGETEVIAGIAQGFSNLDGPALQATFSKPNGIAASYTGDTLWVNTSVPTWPSNSQGLHPGKVRMITGVCSLEDVDCPLLTSSKEIIGPSENDFAQLYPVSPNPSHTEVLLSFNIQDPRQQVQFQVVDGAQQVVKTVFIGESKAGSHSYRVDCGDWAAGVYFVVLSSEGYRLVRKMVVVK